MNLLALETTETVGSVAAMAAGHVLAELALPPPKRSSQSLVPILGQLLDQVGWQARQVQLVTVSIGPGSFTGLRIGVTAAKVFAYAVGAGIVAVPSLQVVARQAPVPAAPLWAVIDAHRDQLFTSLSPQGRPTRGRQWSADARITSVDQWLGDLEPGHWVTGPALRRYASRLPANVRLVDPTYWSPTATTVARIGWQRYQEGQRDDLWQLVPQYVRKSAAEEKWERRNG